MGGVLASVSKAPIHRYIRIRAEVGFLRENDGKPQALWLATVAAAVLPGALRVGGCDCAVGIQLQDLSLPSSPPFANAVRGGKAVV
jgi:hypothetical protein